jgi:hypothetical protein
VRERSENVSGKLVESVPEGCDAYLLEHIVHDWNDEQALAILRNCRTAMTGSASWSDTGREGLFEAGVVRPTCRPLCLHMSS